MSRLRWPDSTNSVSEKPGTIQYRVGAKGGGTAGGHDRRLGRLSANSRDEEAIRRHTASCGIDHPIRFGCVEERRLAVRPEHHQPT